ncbi:energy transducer TonB [Parapedobacter deserti]|uniref:Energy transducer TonB n=1 Tax=Parapedobacter deserti TaxID=1912957 RepID=A0ABV7JKP5_9SPHI
MIYLLLANLYLGIFYGFYRAILCKRTFFQWNRFYLLAGLLLAFTLPLLEHPSWNTTGGYPDYLVGIQVGESVVVEAGAVEVDRPSPFTLRNVLTYGYIGGCLLTFFMVLRRLTMTLRMLRRHSKGDAFSFFGIVRVDRTMMEHDRIRLHEQVHVREWHSVDVVLMQLVKIFNWFNPVVYAYERALRLQHEYIADGKSAAGDTMAYAELLVARAMGADHQVLMHTFSSKRLLKSRVAMLLRDKSPRLGLLSYMLLLPLIGGMVVLSFACNQRQGHEQRGDGVVYQEADLGVSGAEEDAKQFKMYLAKNIDYAAEAIHEGKQGMVAFTYEKAENGTIERVKFLNELWEGQQVDILNVLQRDQAGRVAPVGKYLVSVDFRLSGRGESQVAPPPPPVPDGYVPLGSIAIIGYSPDSPPPPPVERKSAEQEDNAARQLATPKTETPVDEVDSQQDIAGARKTEVIEKSTDVIFQSVEIEPTPAGGLRAYMEYIGQNYDYPQAAIDAGVNGKLLVSFIVEKDGSLTDIKVLEDLGYGTGEAAVRVLQNGGKWSPGIQNGRPVRVAYTLPIRLNLQS